MKMTKKELGIFERKILRKIYGPVNENGEWRIRYNKELYELYKSSDITDIKIARLRWAGHVQRMKNDEMVKRIMEGKPKIQNCLMWMIIIKKNINLKNTMLSIKQRNTNILTR